MARGSGQLFGPIPHFLSERTASHFRSRSRLCCRRWMITLCVSGCTLHKRTILPAASPDKRRKHKRYGALSCGNGEDGIAAVLGGVALIDLFGSLRRPPLPTLARPGPQNSFLLRIPFRPPPPLHPSFAPVFPCQRLRRTTRHAHASLSLHPRSSFRRLSGTLFTFRSYFPSIICQPTQVVILPPQRNFYVN